jgi:alkylhydroperoxidase/carboxymuconolactone decarboxylase family protein YurZ
MVGDAIWYEAAYVVGITNALNVAADGLAALPTVTALLPLVSEGSGAPEVAALFKEIREFYARPDVPPVFRFLARDPGYAADVWGAARRAFDDNRLSRRLKESLAFAVSVSTRSEWGSAFHLEEMRRLGVGDGGIMEVVGVTQMFSSYTKIADTLQLEPDMGDIAPADESPAPGAPPRQR